MGRTVTERDVPITVLAWSRVPTAAPVEVIFARVHTVRILVRTWRATPLTEKRSALSSATEGQRSW
jgi:hypothetical protein